jgi:hypothetical protein
MALSTVSLAFRRLSSRDIELSHTPVLSNRCECDNSIYVLTLSLTESDCSVLLMSLLVSRHPGGVIWWEKNSPRAGAPYPSQRSETGVGSGDGHPAEETSQINRYGWRR